MDIEKALESMVAHQEQFETACLSALKKLAEEQQRQKELFSEVLSVISQMAGCQRDLTTNHRELLDAQRMLLEAQKKTEERMTILVQIVDNFVRFQSGQGGPTIQ
jgi:hypothetical protein